MKNPKKLFLFVIMVLIIPAFMWQQAAFWGAGFQAQAVDAVATVDPNQAAKEQEAQELKEQQDSLLNKIKKTQKAKVGLLQDAAQTQQAVSSTQGVINKTKSTIQETAADIARKEAEVANMNKQIALQTEMLRNFMQQLYYNQEQPILNVVLSENNFAESFSPTEHLLTLEDKIINISNDIADKKALLEQDKSQLADVKEKHEQILSAKLDEKQDLVSDLVDTQQQIQKADATIAELQQKLAELQSDLNVLTGKSFNAKDIRDAVEYASKKEGVPRGVLYGFLKMETNLGANTGQCTYKEVEKVAISRYKKYGSKYKNSIALLYKREDLFYDLMDKLDYSKDKKVSCSPSGYIGQGGAMGIPQFMSDVWNNYSSSISEKTGHTTPDPWDITDGVMAMAIKLRNAGATSDSPAVIRKASINYLGTFYANYYNGIVYWSKNYSKLFD